MEEKCGSSALKGIMRSSTSRSQYWLRVLAWVGIIYASLPGVRPLCDFLKAKTPFLILINSFIAIVLIVLAVEIIRWRVWKGAFSYFLIWSIFVSYGYLLLFLKIPEEKIHLIEYGFLAFLVFRAVSLDYQGIKRYAMAFVISSLLGWLDEVIQHFLPNRYYQNSDVLLNMVSAGLGLWVVFIFEGGNGKKALSRMREG